MIVSNENILQVDYEVVEPWRGFDGADDEVNHSTRKVIIPEQFRSDVAALCQYSGLPALIEGTTLQMSLQEALCVMSRVRRRVDAFKPLVEYLRDEMNVLLIIHSQKTKQDEN